MGQNTLSLRQRVARLRRILPLILAVGVVLFQAGPMRWMHNNLGYFLYSRIEILFYASAGPLAIYWALKLVDYWLREKEQAEQLASATERRLASITSASADAILSLDANGIIESWNRGAELLFGYTAPDIQGRPFSVLVGGEAATTLEFGWLKKAVQQEGFMRGHEMIGYDAQGQAIDVELTATLLTGEDAQPASMSIILRDITNRKRREAEIRQLNASLNEQVADRTRELAIKVDELTQANLALQVLDKSRSELISLVSHQVRSPLTNIQGAIQRMQTDCHIANPTCRRMFTILNQETIRLDRLVQDVLNTTRLEASDISFHPEPISLLPVVQQIVEQNQPRLAGRTIQLPLKPGLPLVYADQHWVAEVLANLLGNAVKYSPPGQKILLDARADQTEVTISVRDCGPGLQPNDLERIFDKFYRADSSDSQTAYGYGLGLYVCRHLVTAQHGRIWAENHPDGGAVFSFTLPVWQGYHD
jgi:PAS domain S-box-containing protein